MGNVAVLSQRLSQRQLFDLLETYYTKEDRTSRTGAYRQLLLGITSFKKHVADVASEHALFTGLRLRDMFSA